MGSNSALLCPDNRGFKTQDGNRTGLPLNSKCIVSQSVSLAFESVNTVNPVFLGEKNGIYQFGEMITVWKTHVGGMRFRNDN